MKNNLKKYLVFLLTLVLCFTMVLAACNPDDEPDDTIDEETDSSVTLTVNNGNFATTTDTATPAAPSSWTATGGSSTVKGMVSIAAEKYAAYKTNAKDEQEGFTYWYDAPNPGKSVSEVKNLSADNNVLMLYNSESGYGGYYGSSTVSIAAGTDYVLSLSVKTKALTGAGARIYIYGSSTLYHEVMITDADSDWTTYEIYIEGHKTTSKTFSIYLTLGTNALSPASSGYAAGWAYFDNVYLYKLGEADTKYENASYASATANGNTLTKVSATVGNPEFNFVTSSNTPGMYSVINSGNGNNVYRRVDTSAAAWEANKASYGYSDSAAVNPQNPGNIDGTFGNNYVYMLYNSQESAIGMTNNVKLTMERCRSYAISIWVKLQYVNVADQTAVTLKLLNDSEELGVIETDSSAIGNWTKYTFYVIGNESVAKNLTFQFHFGTGTSAKDTNFSSGWAWFDNLEYKAVEEEPTNDLKIDLRSGNANMLSNGFFQMVNPLTGFSALYDDGSPNLMGGVDSSAFTAGVWDTNDDGVIYSINGGTISLNGVEKPELAFSYADYPLQCKRIFVIDAATPGIFNMTYKDDSMSLNAYSYYKLSFWVKTVDVQSTAGIYAYLMDTKGTAADVSDDSTLASVTLLNTDKITSGLLNGWQEVSFIIQTGAEDATVYLKLSFGTGSKWTSSTLADGTAFFSNFIMSAASYSDYSGSSGTYTKTASFVTASSPSFTNGNFNNYDLSDIEGLNDDPDSLLSAHKNGLDGDLKLASNFGTPTGWKLTNNNDKDTSAQVAGIIDLTRDANFFTNVVNHINDNDILNINDFSNVFMTPSAIEDYQYVGGNKVLLLASTDVVSNAPYASLSYKTSSSTTLTSSAYYCFTVLVKTIRDATATVYMFGTDNKVLASFTVADTAAEGAAHNGWVKYSFYIQTGITSETVTFGLYLGDNSEIGEVEAGVTPTVNGGAVMFDQFTQTTIDKPAFNAAAEGDNVIKLSFTNNSFDSFTSSSNTLVSPTGWTGDDITDGDVTGTKAGVVTTTNRSAFIDGVLGLKSFVAATGDEEAGTVFYKNTGTDDAPVWELWTEGDDQSNKYTNSAIGSAALADLYTRKATLSDELKGFDSDSVLMIYNPEAAAYTFSSSAYSLGKGTYYKITFRAKVFELTEGKKAYGKVFVSNDEIYTFSFDNADWTTFTYYFKVTGDTNITVVFGLGSIDTVNGEEAPNYAAGFALFDDLAFEIVTATAYNSAAENQFTIVKEFVTTTVIDTDPGEDDDEEPVKDNNYRWLIFSSAALGALIIIVLIVYFVRKIKPVRKPRVKMSDYDARKKGEPSSQKNKKDTYGKFKD